MHSVEALVRKLESLRTKGSTEITLNIDHLLEVLSGVSVPQSADIGHTVNISGTRLDGGEF